MDHKGGISLYKRNMRITDYKIIALIIILISLFIILISYSYMDMEDYNNHLNVPISDDVMYVEDKMEYHISTAGLHNRDSLIEYIGENKGKITGITYSTDGRKELTKVEIVWFKKI